MRSLEFRQRYFTYICSIAVVTLALFQRSLMDLKKCAKQMKRQMRCLELRHRYFTDICSIAVVTLALFQRSVMDPEKMRETNKKKTCDTAHTSHIISSFAPLGRGHLSRGRGRAWSRIMQPQESLVLLIYSTVENL
jgi:hypothetical protein